MHLITLFSLALATITPASAQSSTSGMSKTGLPLPTGMKPEESSYVASILATAIPDSLVSLAYTNPAAASSAILSQFAVGPTPAWFSALPSDVQTYLVPVKTVDPASVTMASSFDTYTTHPQTTLYSGISATPSSMKMLTGVTNGTTMSGRASMYLNSTIARPTGMNATVSLSNMTMTRSPSSSTRSTTTTSSRSSSLSSSSSVVEASTSAPANGAPIPTAAAFGAGMAGALGVLGLLAL